MKALVYDGPGEKAWDVARPELDADTDAIVWVDTTTICGTDLHILKGDVPAMIDGRIIGHEAAPSRRSALQSRTWGWVTVSWCRASATRSC